MISGSTDAPPKNARGFWSARVIPTGTGYAKGLAALMSTAMERSNKAILRANSTFKTGGEICWKDIPRGQRCQSHASHNAPDRNLESGNDYETCDDYQTCHDTSSGEE